MINFLLAFIALLLPVVVHANEAKGQHQDIGVVSKKLSNPLSDLWYFATENHYMGFENKQTGETVKGDFFMFQPVLPTKIGKDDQFVLVNRPTLGFLTVDEKAIGRVGPYEDGRYNTELTDFRWLTMLGPNKSEGFIYGAGPMVAAPFHNDLVYTSENWQAGFGLISLYIKKGLVAGFIYTQTFDLVDSATDNQAQLQYMLSYDFNPRFQVYMSPIVDINYDARGGQKLDLPVGIGVKTTFFAFGIPMRLGIAYEHYVMNQDKPLQRDNTIKILWTTVTPNLSDLL